MCVSIDFTLEDLRSAQDRKVGDGGAQLFARLVGRLRDLGLGGRQSNHASQCGRPSEGGPGGSGQGAHTGLYKNVGRISIFGPQLIDRFRTHGQIPLHNP